jgi:menaquinol-cytochrome c reductase iron-sulfur subunit
MTEDKNQSREQTGDRSTQRKHMSRRQFLNYTLGGTGGFLMAMPLVPMLRFTVDPLLRPKEGSDWVKVVEENKITAEPQSFAFEVNVIDGWYESTPSLEAWISRGDDGNIFALSPICKHLGCTVNWDTQAEYPDQYFCPCHGARYTKDGKHLVVAPAPLDEYAVKIENGFVYLGQLSPNTRVR